MKAKVGMLASAHTSMFLRGLFAALLLAISAANGTANPIDTPTTSRGNEVKYATDAAHETVYLSELGLTDHDLKWGKSVDGVRLGALLAWRDDLNSVRPGYDQMVCSIYNGSNGPLVLPLCGRPLVGLYVAGSNPRKWLQHVNPGMSGLPMNSVTLQPGQIMTFAWPLSRVRSLQRLPMIVIFDFQCWGVVDVPSWEKSLALKSGEVRLP